jgi:hypothetical protein
LETITDVYHIKVTVPVEFPKRFPTVKELGGRIDRKFHRLIDGSFCLGSPTRLRLALVSDPTLVGFIERCLIPYLYGYSYCQLHGHLPFGELDHGHAGLIEDFCRLFGVSTALACVRMLQLTAMKKRVANKRPCPCGSGMRLGRCHHSCLNKLRLELGRKWCRAQAAWLADDYPSATEKSIPVTKIQRAAIPSRRRTKDIQRVA